MNVLNFTYDWAQLNLAILILVINTVATEEFSAADENLAVDLMY